MYPEITQYIDGEFVQGEGRRETDVLNPATNLPIGMPLNSLTQSTYDSVFNAIRGTFAGNPTQVAALDARSNRVGHALIAAGVNVTSAFGPQPPVRERWGCSGRSNAPGSAGRTKFPAVRSPQW